MLFAAGLFREVKISNKLRWEAFSSRERMIAMHNELESDHFNLHTNLESSGSIPGGTTS